MLQCKGLDTINTTARLQKVEEASEEEGTEAVVAKEGLFCLFGTPVEFDVEVGGMRVNFWACAARGHSAFQCICPWTLAAAQRGHSEGGTAGRMARPALPDGAWTLEIEL